MTLRLTLIRPNPLRNEEDAEICIEDATIQARAIIFQGDTGDPIPIQTRIDSGHVRLYVLLGTVPPLRAWELWLSALPGLETLRRVYPKVDFTFNLVEVDGWERDVENVGIGRLSLV